MSEGLILSNWRGYLSHSQTTLAEKFVLVVIAIAALWIPLGELLHHFLLRTHLSLNVVLTICYFGLTWVLLVIQGRRVLPALVFVVLAVCVAGAFIQGTEVRHTQYLLTIACFVLGASVTLGARALVFVPRVFLAAGFMAALVATADLLYRFEWIGRANATTAPLTILVLLVFSARERTSIQVFAFVASILALASVSLDTSRMATAASLLILVVWLAAFSGWRLMYRLTLIAAFVLSQLYFWSTNPWAQQRLAGRDNTVLLGPITVNGEGRTEAASIVEHGARNLVEVLIGRGAGKSGQSLVDAGFILDKPHDEFLRLFVDLGIVGAATWIVLILGMFVLGGVLIAKGERKTGFLAGAIGLIILAFSYSDNVMSYSWILAPSGILIAFAMAHMRGPLQDRLWTQPPSRAYVESTNGVEG